MTTAGADLLTPAELAALLKKSTRTLADWRYRNVGPAYIAGRPPLYRAADVNAWLAARRVEH